MDGPKNSLFARVRAFSHPAFATAVEPERIASRISGHDHYRWVLVSKDGTMATASTGTTMLMDRFVRHAVIPLARLLQNA